MKKVVSVIIPVYNREKYIEECLMSVIKQSYHDFEIVLVDDGSTDRTLDICKSIAQKDIRVKIFADHHQGVSAARNLALDNAKGDYIFFLDSDDVIHPQALDLLVRSARNGVSIAVIEEKDVRQKIWNDYILAKSCQPLDPTKVTYCNNSQAIELFFRLGSKLGRIGGALFDRKYVGETRFRTDLHIGEDTYFVYENILKGSDVSIVDSEGYYCRLHSNKLSADVSYEAFCSRLRSSELLWTSEEHYGRHQFAKIEKQLALRNYIGTQMRNDLYSDISRDVCKLMKDYTSVLFPALDLPQKMKLIFSVYLPWLFFPLFRIIKKIKKRNKNY